MKIRLLVLSFVAVFIAFVSDKGDEPASHSGKPEKIATARLAQKKTERASRSADGPAESFFQVPMTADPHDNVQNDDVVSAEEPDLAEDEVSQDQLIINEIAETLNQSDVLEEAYVHETIAMLHEIRRDALEPQLLPQVNNLIFRLWDNGYVSGYCFDDPVCI